MTRGMKEEGTGDGANCGRNLEEEGKDERVGGGIGW